MSALEREIEETRQRLASTIDQLAHRAHPKTIVGRQVTTVKSHFVDLESGAPRTDNILKVAGRGRRCHRLLRHRPEGRALSAPIKMLHDRVLVEVDAGGG
jgi:hypothetical protein